MEFNSGFKGLNSVTELRCAFRRST